MTFLNCYKNRITSLSISGCKQLYQLYCSQNQLTAIDVSSSSKIVKALKAKYGSASIYYSGIGYGEAGDTYCYTDSGVAIIASIQIMVPESLTAIPDECFKNVKADLVRIPRSVTSISATAFDLSTLVICPSGSYAERRCRELGLTVLAE